MKTKISSGEKILFIGDSITDCGCRHESPPLGEGYVKIFSDMITVREPEKKVRIINKGVNGNSVKNLQDRWDEDVIKLKPDWLSVQIGINDLHKFLLEREDNIQLDPTGFEEIYDSMLQKVKNDLPDCSIILIDPFYISTDLNSGSLNSHVLKLLPDYIKAVHILSEKYDTMLVKTHDLFLRRLKFQVPDIYCPEPVHPNSKGHFLIAEAVYIALRE
ncbi:SGNH/GDSL hydrolase family protein [candidate division KSB1 bacterium]